MKLHHPATEASLLQSIARVRGARGLGRHDPAAWGLLKQIVLAVCIYGAFIAFLAVMLGAKDAQFAQPGWRQLTVGGWFTLMALYLSNTLRMTAFNSPESIAMQNMPVPGSIILSWARARTLRRTWTVLATACVAAWVIQGQQVGIAVLPRILSHALALLLVTLATTISLSQPWVQRCGLGRLWGWMCIGFVLVLAVAFFARDSSIVWLHLERIIEPVAPLLSWLLPPAWVSGDRLTWQIAAGALVWTILGVRWWFDWPQAQGHLLDAPRDVFGENEFEEEETAEIGNQPGLPRSPRVPDETHALSVGVGDFARASLATDIVAESGANNTPHKARWIEQLAWHLFSPRDRTIAAMLMPRAPGWSALWNKAAKLSVMVVALMFAARATLPESTFENTAVGLIIAQGVILLCFVVPISNDLHNAFAPFWTSGQQMPFFAGFPLNARDLLRFSSRITWARTLAALPLVVSVFALSSFALGRGNAEIWMGAKISAAILLALAVQRPLAVTYRLQEAARRARRFALGFLVILICVPLLLVDLFGAFMTVLAQFGAVLPDSRGSEFIAAGALLACFLANRAIFETYRWLSLRGCVDFLKQG